LSELHKVKPEEESGYTVVGILEDGAGLNQAISELREAGVTGEDLTAILKRPDPDEPEPFPEGTRYVLIADDSRGLGLTIGFAAVFVVSGLLFAFTTPRIGTVLFVFFISVAALLAVAVFTRVGATPILIDIEAPANESSFWNDEFERGKVLLFASTRERENLRLIWEVFERQGVYFDIVQKRMVPQPVNQAVLHRATRDGSERRVEEHPETRAAGGG
jgi:hypothetical protein